MNTKRSIRWLILGILMFSLSAASFAQIAIGISVRFGPPAIPVYAQPVCPGPGYLWTPGYWAWSDDGGYYWVPGTWVLAPVGLLWTPGYWGWVDGFYRWHPGYWGPHVGFYGGINYGFGYTGVGFFGGEWRGGAFFYNRAVMNVNVTRVTNVYERTVVVNDSHVAFNGGAGGVVARPTGEEERYAHESHTEALAAQRDHEREASHNRSLFASENHGRPAVAATGRPGEFSGRNVVAARAAGEAYHAPKMSPREARATSENRGAEQRRENNRAAAREQNRSESGRAVNRENSRQQTQREKTDRRSEQQQARGEQKQQREQQKQQAKQEKAEHKQAQQAQKRQQQEQKRSGREERGPGR